MTVYDGLAGDPFFVGPDESSSQLRGADNRTFPGAYHNDLRVGPAEVDTYAVAERIERERPNGLYGRLCGIPSLTGMVAGCS